jgi:hypothetical protein
MATRSFAIGPGDMDTPELVLGVTQMGGKSPYIFQFGI